MAEAPVSLKILAKSIPSRPKGILRRTAVYWNRESWSILVCVAGATLRHWHLHQEIHVSSHLLATSGSVYVIRAFWYIELGGWSWKISEWYHVEQSAI